MVHLSTLVHLRAVATYAVVVAVCIAAPVHADAPSWFRDVCLVDPTSDIGMVVGRLHMALIHFPIGLLAAAGLVQLFAPNREPRPGNSILVCLGLGTASALVAVWTGWIHQEAEPVRTALSQTVWLHRWIGVLVAVMSLFAFLLALWARSSGGATVRRIYQLCLAVAVGAVLVNGHLGGSLVHGEGYLWRPLQQDPAPDDPAPEQPAASPAASEAESAPGQPDEPETTDEREPLVPPPMPALHEVRTGRADAPGGRVTYADAAAVIAANCHECHGSETQKAGLRLDSLEELLAWPELLAVDDPGQSVMLEHLRLPLGHEGHMPPDVELAPDDMGTLVAWIEGGSPTAP
ncbi:MAG: DUF2231 domain-containing protein [Planctomycetota bacterium]